MVIENDAEFSEILKNNLRNRLFNVFQVENYEKSLQILKNQAIDFIIFSISDETPELVEITCSGKIPVIICSETPFAENVIRAFNSGACSFILKPVSGPEPIDNAIERCLKIIRLDRQRTLYTKHLENELLEKTREIDNKNLQLRMFNENLRRILDSTFSGPSINRLSDLGTDLLNSFGANLQASGGSIYVNEEDGLRLVHSIEHKHVPDFLPFPLKENSPFQRVLETGKPILVDNIDMEKNLAASGWSGYNDTSFVIFPLPDFEGNIKGLLSLHNKTSPPFLSEDKELGILMSAFYKEVNRAVNSIESLHLSESKYQHITENSAGVIYSFSISSNCFEFINDSFFTLSGFEKKLVIGKDINNFVDVLGVIEKEDVISHFENLITGRSDGSGLEYRITTAAGQEKWVYQQTVTIKNSEGFPISLDGILTEFSDQKETEEKLKALVEQKDMLLNEINHRVKNNLQIISSLVHLQDNAGQENDRHLSLQNINNRINAIAMIHDNIYDTELMPAVNIRHYLEKMLSNLCETYHYADCINIVMEISEITLDLDRSIICGLIINEAVSNAFTHAFEDILNAELKLTFKVSGNNYIVSIIDNGCGFDRDIMNDSKKDGLGLVIMEGLIDQLEGSLEIFHNKGTEVSIRFPVEDSKIRKELL